MHRLLDGQLDVRRRLPMKYHALGGLLLMDRRRTACSRSTLSTHLGSETHHANRQPWMGISCWALRLRLGSPLLTPPAVCKLFCLLFLAINLGY